jgi:esterase
MKLAFKKTGSGYPVVILHGLYGSGDNWFTIAKNLSQHFEVYLPDQRNHGQSGRSDEIDYNLLTSDLEEFFNDHEIQVAHLIGHSMGGKVAMNFALKNPEKVKKLLVVDIALRAYPSEGEYALQSHFHRKIINLLLSIDIQKTNSRTEIDSYLAKYIKENQVRQFLLKNLKRNNDGSFFWRLNLKSLDKNIHKLLDAVDSYNKTFKSPVLLISGKNSGYIKYSDLDDFTKVFTDFSHCELDSGHWVHVEQAEKFMEVLKKFLN